MNFHDADFLLNKLKSIFDVITLNVDVYILL